LCSGRVMSRGLQSGAREPAGAGRNILIDYVTARHITRSGTAPHSSAPPRLVLSSTRAGGTRGFGQAGGKRESPWLKDAMDFRCGCFCGYWAPGSWAWR
jgi:hypothetical protein